MENTLDETPEKIRRYWTQPFTRIHERARYLKNRRRAAEASRTDPSKDPQPSWLLSKLMFRDFARKAPKGRHFRQNEWTRLQRLMQKSQEQYGALSPTVEQEFKNYVRQRFVRFSQ